MGESNNCFQTEQNETSKPQANFFVKATIIAPTITGVFKPKACLSCYETSLFFLV